MAPGKQNRSDSTSGKNKTTKKSLSTDAPWLCIVCDDALDNDSLEAIECHGCKKWCHFKCSDLNKHQLECLKGGGNFILWLCPNCREGERTATQNRMETKLDCVLKMLENLTNRMNAYEEAQKECTPESIDKKIDERLEEKVEEFMVEKEEREKRKLNIIISNLPEPEGSQDEKKEEDKKRVRDLVKSTLDEGEVSIKDIDNPLRLGAIHVGSGARPRPLRMTVKSEDDKIAILRNARKINKDVAPEKRIYINEDLTPREREKFKNLRAELKERKEQGEDDLFLSYRDGRIVKRKFVDKKGQGPQANQGQTNHKKH